MPTYRWTAKAPPDFKSKLTYQTRQMVADDGQIELSAGTAGSLLKAGFVEAVTDEQPERRGPGRPKKTETPSQPVAAIQPKQDQPYLTRAQLLSVAERRGVELPPGYVTRDELAVLVGDVSSDEVAEAGG